MKDAEETNLRSEMLGVARHFAECFSDGTEQQILELDMVLPNERVEFVREREYDVEVTCLKQFLLPRIDPPPTRLSLTLVAMTIATAVV